MSKLERLANLSVIVACVCVAGDIGWRRLAPPPATAATAKDVPDKPRPLMKPVYNVGEVFPALPGIGTVTDEAALLLVVKESCGFCTASVPFYQRLGQAVQDLRPRGAGPRLLGVCSDPTETCIAYFKRNNVAVDGAVGVAPELLKIEGTPTLLLLERGKVASVWVGRLAEQREEEVLAALSRKRG